MRKKIVLFCMMFVICLFSFWSQATFASDETNVEYYKEELVEEHKEESVEEHKEEVVEEQKELEYEISVWSEDSKTTLIRLLTNLHKNINKQHPEFSLCENLQWSDEITNVSIEKLEYQFVNYISQDKFESNAYENVYPYENQEMIVMGSDNKSFTTDQLYLFLENVLSGNYENENTVKIIKDFLEIEEVGAAYNVFSVESKHGIHELISYKKLSSGKNENIEQELYDYIKTELLNNRENVQALLQDPKESTDSQNDDILMEDQNVPENQDSDVNVHEDSFNLPEESEKVIEQTKSHWITDAYGKKYCFADGRFATGYTLIDGYYYYFDQNGYMQVGHVVADGQAYQFWHEAGYGRSKGWVNYPDGKKAYCLGNGKLAVGYVKIENKYYYFGNDGYMQVGYVVIDGQAYQFWHEAGYGRPKGWVNYPDGKKAYCLGNGKLAVGYTKIENRYYYFGNDGYMQVGHVVADGQVYQFWHEAGYGRPKGWVNYPNGKKAYCLGNGKLAVGYTKIENKYYYFSNDGYMQVGHVVADGQAYQFWHEEGYGRPTGWVVYPDGKKAYCLGNGKLALGQLKMGKIIYYFDNEGYLINTEKKGIDVSEFQGSIDWKSVKNAGVEFAFIRVGGRYGISGKFYEDKQYHTNMKGAIQNDIDTGVYFFTQAITEAEAIEEARFACSRLRGYNIKLPVVIDTESLEGCRHNKLTVQQRTNVVKAFCEEVIRQGYKPMIYSGLYWLQGSLDMSQLTKYDVWVAQYNSTCDYKGKYSCWQYTSKGSVSGIKGNVDLNIWYDNK